MAIVNDYVGDIMEKNVSGFLMFYDVLIQSYDFLTFCL